MLFDFFNYLHNNDLGDYLNCYSTFLISRKELKKRILNIRKNILIDTYIKINNNNKFYYNTYYLNNYYDEFMNKPLINNNFKPIISEEDDDIDDHYKLMFIKNPEKKIVDYEELDRLFVEEELKREEQEYYDNLTEIDEDDYYDDEENIYDDNYNNTYDDDEYDEY